MISAAHFADWATPIVSVAKRDGSVQIYGDYKIILNQTLEPEVYLLPKIVELFVALAGGINFANLNLSHANQQLVLDESSDFVATINTHKGLVKYNHLPFGFATAPTHF